MSKSGSITLTPNDIVSNSEVGEVKLRQKSAFAVQHMMAAARFSRQCGEVQKENIEKDLGPFFDEQISCVSATIMLCVASLESNINEYLSEAEKLFPNISKPARDQFIALLEPLSVLDKYQKTLSFKGFSSFDKGRDPFQSVDAIITLRNELVHFHPEWHDEQERHNKLGKKLIGKFEFSPFMNETNAVIFPQRFISHGCTEWAVESCIKFMDKFAVLNEFESKFERFSDRLVG